MEDLPDTQCDQREESEPGETLDPFVRRHYSRVVKPWKGVPSGKKPIRTIRVTKSFFTTLEKIHLVN